MPPTVNTFKGWLDIQDRLSSVHPQNWASEFYQYLPLDKKKGMLTIHSEAYGNDPTDSQTFNYWDRAFNQRSGAVIDVFDGPGLTNATAGASASGSIVNVQLTAANAKLYNVGDQMQLTSTLSSAFTTVVGRVTSVSIAGDTTSYVTLTLMETDTDSVCASSAIRFNPAGQSFPNKTELPSGRFYEVNLRTGVCANHLGAWSLTPHEIKEKSRLRQNAGQIAIEDATQDLLISSEMGKLWSVQDTSDPGNLKMGGLKWILQQRTTAGRNIINFKTDSTYFTNGETGNFPLLGYQWLRNIGEYLGRWQGDGGEWNVYCGGLAMEAVNAMITERSHYEITTGTDDYGFNFTKLHMLSGSWKFYEHPLFVNEAAYQNMMIVTRPQLIKTRVFLPMEYVQPQRFAQLAAGINGGSVAVDGTNWSTELKGGWFMCQGLQVDCPDAHAIINGVGLGIERT